MAESLLTTLERSAGDGGLIPEQIWDGPDLPEHELFHGRPSGSAMPLVWAHSEHIKLLRSLADGAVFDRPPQGVERYIRAKTPSNLRIWRFNNRLSVIPSGKTLRLELPSSAIVHWSFDEWTTVNDTPTVETGFESHFVDLPTQDAAEGGTVVFTFLWQETGQWENQNFGVRIGE